MKKLYLALWALMLIVMQTGCASVSLVNSWKDAEAPAKQYRKLLVVGVANNNQMRQVFEEVFSDELRKMKLTAISSYTITGVEAKQSRESLEEAVRKTGADGVLITRLVNLKRNTTTQTGFIMSDRGFSHPDFYDPVFMPTDLYGYYGATVSYATFEHRTVEVTTSTVATLQTNLFDAGTGRMVWLGTTSAVDPKGVITVSSKLSGVVIRALASQGLI
ncbi:hypothetical protein [Geobacter sp.]|uniref:hypothetical protein n=1 Tax=Geobacter sp. TaxID=46610 RepID=UPI0027B88455|nr:hypothetical protein [Geobacter sp.]